MEAAGGAALACEVLSSQGGWKVWVLRTEVPEWAPELLGPGVSIMVE